MGNFTPSLFIGVGGVGKNILLRIRRMVIENHKKFETLPSIRFLHVDTDVNPGPDAGSSMPIEVMGQKLQFNDSEKCDLARRITQEIEQGKDIVKENPAVKEWFDDSLQLDLNFKDGAGGIRPYGRLAFHYSVNIFRERVANAVSDAKNQLNLQKTAETLGMSPDNNLGIYVVCSLLGGLGAGLSLKCAITLSLQPRKEELLHTLLEFLSSAEMLMNEGGRIATLLLWRSSTIPRHSSKG